jgi:glycosyltransferase involved in cell wall biosynthesis
MTRFGFISTFPPTRCGIATFTLSLAKALTQDPDDSVKILRLLDEADAAGEVPEDFGRVVAEVGTADSAAHRAAAVRSLGDCDVVIVQHEYGIFGGDDGDHVISLLQALEAPAIVVLHTVLASPSAHQREVLERVTSLANAVVVMTDHALRILRDVYQVDMSRVQVIPHGVAPASAHARHTRGTRPRILTWGFLSPGKGIERGIRCLALLRTRGVQAEYVVAGETHPKVRAKSGEAYRDELAGLARALGVEDLVTFEGHYHSDDAVADLVDSADVVLLPYESREQATSGVLVEAVASGVPVVATAFPHAVELLADGVGTSVPHDDLAAMAAAIEEILTKDPGEIDGRQARAGTGLTWPQVAERYAALARRLEVRRAA